MLLIFGLNDLGISLWPVLTSLGVIGLAVAFALRATLSNLIGTFMIHAEDLFSEGEDVIIRSKRQEKKERAEQPASFFNLLATACYLQYRIK